MNGLTESEAAVSSNRFVFHPLAAVAPGGPADNYLTSNDPSIALEELLELDEAGGSPLHRRHAVQLEALGERKLRPDAAVASPLFDDDLSLACRVYRVRRIWADDAHERERSGDRDVPLGNAPPRVAGRPLAGAQLAELAGRGAEPEQPEHLYLFNVIVALEWVPTPQRLRRLQWAFRRASDYLYDVTNGGMAFGQVIFAGPDWLHCADIQILASNRYLPRSWVSALLDPKKYTPIRLGRGLWVRERRIVIDWDEPEGYRSIVHEWAHYALGLKDEYMHARKVTLADRYRLRKGAGGPGTVTIVDVDRQVKSESIMASVQGNSELTNPLLDSGAGLENLREVIKARYRHLEQRFAQSWSGPGQLPLPLPHFRLVDELAETEQRANEHSLPVPFLVDAAAAGRGERAPVTLDELAAPKGRWEIFLARFAGATATRLSYQGELDARSPQHGFTLLGGDPEDTVLLVGDGGRGHEVWSRQLGQLTAQEDADLVGLQWRLRGPQAEAGPRDATEEQAARLDALLAQAGWRPGAPVELPAEASPPALGATEGEGGEATAQPLAATELLPLQSRSGAKTNARVQLTGGDTSTAVFSIAGAPGEEVPLKGEGKTFDLPSLDGYTLTVGPPGGEGAAGGPALIIGDFSQGGPPRSAPAMVSDPIAAGAASGEALILCDVPLGLRQLNTDRYRVVTAGYRGLRLPQPPTGEQFVARSPIFTVSSNLKLLEIFNPSLLIVNISPDPDEAEQLRICRFNEQGGLDVLPTFLEPGVGYGIAPLQAATCPGLISRGEDPDKEEESRYVERFVLALAPEDALRDERPAQSA